jgi:UDP-hydrolysing UDP-N-acetyl-D-glucosamine 2-epimerase
MAALSADPRAQLQLIVTGTHLAVAHGRTIDHILADGFRVDAEVEMPVDGSDPFSTGTAAGQVMIGMASALRRLRPDLMLVLGDRYEILAAVQAAHLGLVPVAHLHGGEITRGSLDDTTRHAITKLSRLHLTSTVEHRNRVIQLGEAPDAVHVVGAPGLENLVRLPLDDDAAFARRIGRPLGAPKILLTYHPATAESGEDPVAAVEAMLAALSDFPGATVIATGSNADTGGETISARLRRAAAETPDRFIYVETLGQVGFLSALTNCDVTLGNSSSGIIEAPSAGIATVNVGSRQDGRPRAPAVIDCPPETAAIRAALERALSPEVRERARRRANPYAGTAAGTADGIGRRIADLLLETDPTWLHATKPFYDLSCSSAASVP